MFKFRYFLIAAVFIHASLLFFWRGLDAYAPEIQSANTSSEQNQEESKIFVAFTQNSAQEQQQNKELQAKNLISQEKSTQNTSDNTNQNSLSAPTHTIQDLYVGTEKAPTYARFIPPSYPKEALEQGLSGYVLMRVFVDEKGKPLNVDILESSDPIFEKNAKEAAMASSYKPHEGFFFTEKTWVRVPIRFQLRS